MQYALKRRYPIILAMLIAASAVPARAVVTEWRFPVNGAYNVASNWSTGIPVSGDIALFNITGTYTVSFPGRFLLDPPVNRASDQVLVNRGNVSFVDFLDPLLALQVPNPYTVNSIVIGPLAGVSAQLNTTLGDFNAGSVSIADAAGSIGTLNVNGGELSVTGNFTLGKLSTGFLNVTGGGKLIQSSGNATIGLTVGPGIIASGGAIVTGSGSTWSTNGLTVGFDGFGSLSVENGGSVTSSSSSVGSTNSNTTLPPTGPPTRTGVVTVGGTGSSWTNSGTITVGSGNVTFPSQGTLNINIGGTVSTGSLSLNINGAVNLEGGQLNLGSLTAVHAISFNAGTLRFTGNKSLDDSSLDLILGDAHTIGPLRHLAVANSATLLSSLILGGGTFSAGQLANGQLLHLAHGTLNLTNQAIVIDASGALGSMLDLAADTTVNVSLGLTNRGLVRGDGQIGGTFHNDTGGELRAEPGQSLTLTGAANTNAGQINLLGGLIDFTQNLTNQGGGFISGNGTLIAGSGLVNHGVMNFAGTANVIGNVTNSATGKIISGGGGAAIFYDDATNQGEIRTSANAFTVFFGAVTGAGTFTGTGTVNFEGDLSPGNSPALLTFGGHVQFGAESSLSIELAGTVAGAEYDRLDIEGTAALAGTLDVSLLGGFTPAAGDEFEILTAGTISGTFATTILPALSGNLFWNVSYGANSVMLEVVPAGQAGDFDGDGDVDGADFVAWQTNFPKPTGATLAQGDADGDGDVDGADFVVWQTNFPFTPGPGVASVPEPATVVLLGSLLPAALIFARRRVSGTSRSAVL